VRAFVCVQFGSRNEAMDGDKLCEHLHARVSMVRGRRCMLCEHG